MKKAATSTNAKLMHLSEIGICHLPSDGVNRLSWNGLPTE
jgi:hypothetical protein